MKNIAVKIGLYLEMIKIEHSIFALPFAYLGLFLAEDGFPPFSTFFWVTVAMVSFRSMAMGLNRLLDCSIDAKNPRTAQRALPTGKLKTGSVIVITIIFLGIFEFSAWCLNPLCFQLSPLPVLLAVFYPLTKRFTWLSHWVLGMILGIAPYGAWLASRQEFSWVPAWLMVGVMTWVAGFDIIYALQDQAFDRQHGLYSLPACFGEKVSLFTTQILHGMTLVAWTIAGLLGGRGLLYFTGIVFVAFFLFREHWLIRAYGSQKIQEAFFTMNAVVSVSIFMAAVADLSIGGGAL